MTRLRYFATVLFEDLERGQKLRSMKEVDKGQVELNPVAMKLGSGEDFRLMLI